MKEILFDWPQTASALVHQAKTGCDLARLIMDGVAEVESWLIAHQILPMLREKGLKTIGFSMLVRGRQADGRMHSVAGWECVHL